MMRSALHHMKGNKRVQTVGDFGHFTITDSSKVNLIMNISILNSATKYFSSFSHFTTHLLAFSVTNSEFLMQSPIDIPPR